MSQPSELFSVLQGHALDSSEMSWASFLLAWRGVWEAITTSESDIDHIILYLERHDLIQLGKDVDSLLLARNLVFSIIGWQTMLYRPGTGSCSQRELAIVDETEGFRGQAHLSLRHSQAACNKRPHEFLMGFGVMLPCRDFSAMSSDEDKKAIRQMRTVAPDLFNTNLLSSLGGVRLIWTDVLSCHLEFDDVSHTMYLYRFPSFCIAHLQSTQGDRAKSTLHACAAPHNNSSHWATTEDVDELLSEILLSYRLLFGQDKDSRALFRVGKVCSPHGCIPVIDGALASLCGRKTCDVFNFKERAVYDLQQDFPVLKSRLVTAMRHLASKRPRTWRELWQDKRDSGAWLTFWAVIIIGGIGLVLAFIQTVLSAVQVAVSVKK